MKKIKMVSHAELKNNILKIQCRKWSINRIVTSLDFRKTEFSTGKSIEEARINIEEARKERKRILKNEINRRIREAKKRV